MNYWGQSSNFNLPKMLANTLLLDKVTGFKTVIVFNRNHSLRGGVFILSKSTLDMVLVSEFDKFLVEVKRGVMCWSYNNFPDQ